MSLRLRSEWYRHLAAVHRMLFTVCALLLLAGVVAGIRINPLDTPVLTGFIILFLGVPHGAFDVAIWRTKQGQTYSGALLAMLVRYLALAGGFLCLWLLVPSITLPSFIAISIYHFSGDWRDGLESIPRSIVAAAALCAPAGLHRDEVVEIFSWLAPAETAQIVGLVMALAAVPLLQASAVIVAVQAAQSPWMAAEIVAVLALAWLTSPLVFFVVYFCGLHSIRHMLETQHILKTRSFGEFILAAFPYAPLAIGGTLIGAITLSTLPLGPAIIGTIFMALGALTLPHIIIVEACDET